MLRLLEEKELVTSEYHLAPEKSGPGRTERLFLPTPLAQDIFRSLEEELGDGNWEAFKQQILDKLSKGKIRNRELVEEILARVPPESEGQMQYCVEVMTIVALRLRSRSGRRVLFENLPKVLVDHKPATRANLCLLGGFTLGLLANEDTDDYEWEHQLFTHVQSYVDVVTKLSVRNCRLLGDYLAKVFASLEENL